MDRKLTDQQQCTIEKIVESRINDLRIPDGSEIIDTYPQGGHGYLIEVTYTGKPTEDEILPNKHPFATMKLEPVETGYQFTYNFEVMREGISDVKTLSRSFTADDVRCNVDINGRLSMYAQKKTTDILEGMAAFFHNYNVIMTERRKLQDSTTST